MNNLIKVQDTYKLPYTIKAEWTAYLVFSIMFVPITLLWIIDYRPDTNSWQPILILLSILTLFLIWIKIFRITLENNKIFYKTLFSKKELLFSDIKKIEIATGIDRTASEEMAGVSFVKRRMGAFIRMNISSKNELLSINMKPFSKRNLIIIVDAITIANSNVELDAPALALKQGDFKPVVSATIGKIWQILLYIFWIFLAIDLFNHFIK